MKIFSLIILISLVNFCALSQVFTPVKFNDGVYQKENVLNKKPIKYTPLREADVQWSKRIWREVDMREKINQSLYYPIDTINGKISLLQLIFKGILSKNPEESILAFEDDAFLRLKDTAKFREFVICQPKDSVQSEGVDSLGNTYVTMVLPKADPLWAFEELKSIVIKEDWFFDKQKSVMDVRIIGIGFVLPRKCDKRDEIGEQFWVYFPQIRPLLAKNEIYNTKNDAERRSFDDIFWKRQFNSKITRESNVFDRGVDRYAVGLDALLENERIKNDIFKYEHDFWQF